MSNSTLVTKFMAAYAGNFTPKRSLYGKIEKITIHHCASIMSIEALGRLWQTPGRQGSSHYGVSGSQIGQYVGEGDIAWTDSNWASNCFSVTIEVSNSAGAPNWPVSDASLATLIKLVADIARRNGLGKLVPGKNLTWHQMYAATACPGPYLLGKMQYIADQANAINVGAATGEVFGSTLYRVQVGAFKSKDNAAAQKNRLAAKGFDGFIQDSGGLYRVQLGAFAQKSNAQAYLKRVQQAGFGGFVKEAG